jgi:predicted ATPase
MRTEPFFSSVSVRWDELDSNSYPANLPAVKHIEKVQFHPAVTYLVGENAMGKSTLIEAIAVAAGFNAEGGTKNFQTDNSGTTDIELADAITLRRNAGRETDGYFLRAEAAYKMATYVNQIGVGSYGDLHQVSHGESFMQIFSFRFKRSKNCLFILDEVESALSPQRQLEFLALLHTHIERGSQFIISTHSPILMAYPNSRLYWLSREGIEERNWKDTDHFKIYESWVKHPEKMVNILLTESMEAVTA